MHIEPSVTNLERKTRADKKGLSRLENSRSRPFISWDGEGYNDDNGNHHYALFGNSLGQYVTGISLTWRECLPLLFQSPKNAHHVIFSGTYDVVMLFRSEAQAPRLMQGLPIWLDQYRVKYLRGKMLQVTDRSIGETRTLYDVFSFFGTSFVNACQEYLGASDVLDAVSEMKQQRNSFTQEVHSNGSVLEYMQQELRLLVELCEQLRQRLAAVDIHPTQWHGPGAVASTVLKAHNIKSYLGSYSDEFRSIAESAYYGGRFEQFQRGAYEDTVYQYDIRSAYPSVIVDLPDLTNVEYVYTDNVHNINPYGLYYIDYRNRKTNLFSIGWLPNRAYDGTIFFPPHFSIGWYWGLEIPEHLLPFIVSGYEPKNLDLTVKPFAFVADMYTTRARLKAEGKPQQLALKLALNSLYGKLAQSKGAVLDKEGTWVRPTFHEIVWAGLVTAGTRAKISQALHSVDHTYIIATETDSVFSTVPLELDIGTGLGQWELTKLEGIKYIQSGVSLVKQYGEWKFKTRGFTVSRKQNEVEIWEKFLEGTKPLAIKQTRFGTDHRLDNFGTWYEVTHNLTLDGLGKRMHLKCPNCKKYGSYLDGLHWLFCPPVLPQQSTAYSFSWRAENQYIDETLEPILRMEYIQ